MEELFLIVLGLVVGSFLNVVIHRLPLEESIVKPRSHCPSCHTLIPFYDNIPVISYLLLRGRCRRCRARISFMYPLVEMLTALGFWLAYIHFADEMLYAGFSILFICLLLIQAFIDLTHMILPLEISIGGAVVFLIYSFFSPVISPLNAFGSAAGAALAFAAIYFFYLKVRKIEGLGQGDIWMMLLLGSFLGVNKLVIAILLASISGVIVGIFFIIVKKKNLKLALPFGTFLSLGSFVSLFWGSQILSWIQSLYR
jgi:leader peptidase (prepilin peptidase) / N-methyltransferase